MSEQLAILKKDVVGVVSNKINQYTNSGELHLPKNYSADNAMKSAWLMLQEVQDKNGKLAVQTCTKDSIANSLLDMVVQGLNPSKKQCYFIPYGAKLAMMRSYMGTIALLKRLDDVKDVFANVVYEKDEFEYQIIKGRTEISKHTQKLENVDINKIKAAYATIITVEGIEYSEIMNMDQIKKSWAMSKMSNNKTHVDFKEEMCKRTVTNRLAKWFINVSDDSNLDFVKKSIENREEDEDNLPEETFIDAEYTEVDGITVDRTTGEIVTDNEDKPIKTEKTVTKKSAPVTETPTSEPDPYATEE
jgi:recombination protein RecT